MNEIERIQKNFEQGEYQYFFTEDGETIEKTIDTLLAHITELQEEPDE